MKALLLVRHGPELRLLDSLQKSGRYAEIVVLAESRIESEVLRYLGGRYSCLAYEQPKSTRIKRAGIYLSALMDSIARRFNRKRGIGHYSYSKRSTRATNENSHRARSISKLMLHGLSGVFKLLTAVSCLLSHDKKLRSALCESACDYLIACDHLGGSDAVTYNACGAGMKIHYYLNNHKDLSIRPYVPIVANRMFSWFEDQKKVALDIASSHRKMTAIGLLRANSLVDSASGTQPNAQVGTIRVLHCCADSQRRPYEIHSLVSIFELVKGSGLPVRFTLRLNPMGPAIDKMLLAEFDFVDVAGHGWYWDEHKFLNFPDADAETLYARQIKSHDIVSALPSTAMVEAWCFSKPIICLLDKASPDAETERMELSLCVPENVITGRSSSIAHSPSEYVEILREMANAV